MKTTATNFKKTHLIIVALLFISFWGFSQNSNPTITNITLCGDKSVIPINSVQQTKFTWSSPIPLYAFIDSACTIPYSEELKTTLYLKPDLSQFELETFTIKVTTYSENDRTETQFININNKTKVWNGGSSN